MQLAMYKGPPTELRHWLGHAAVCLATLSRYSHCELVIDGVCHSASQRDGGVRAMAIDVTTRHWDVFPVVGDAAAARAWFQRHDGAAYDWAGIAHFVQPFFPGSRRRWFCSEACAAALGLPRPHQYTPASLLRRVAPVAVLT